MAGNIPGLDVSFEWVKDVLKDQSRTADALESKGTNLFNVATAVLGVGVAAGVLASDDVSLGTIIFGALALIAYGWVAGFSFEFWRLRKYDTMNNPIIIRESFWDLSPQQFKIDILTHMEDAYTENNSELQKKARALKYIIRATVAEVVLLVFALAFTL
ncbi:MAG: hypothetical protein JW762_01410 [Dehalococcoidales bacterium]|nr:hypothetical protein [Dehalococcoidales bacterium]